MNAVDRMQEVRIALCDDDENVRSTLANLAARFSRETGAPLNTYAFEDGESLLRSNTADYDVLFLDIQMPGLDGMQTARRLRSFNRDIRLVFVTDYEQYAIEGYEVQAFRFLKKPIRYEQFFEIMSKTIEGIRQDRSRFSIKNRSGVHYVRSSHILYAETFRRHTLLHTAEEDIECSLSMSSLENELGTQFFRCHTAYLVNLKHVQHVASAEILLANRERIPLSKHRRAAFLQAAMNYWGKTIL